MRGMSGSRDNLGRTVTANLRVLLEKKRPLLVPGASDALSARMIETHGYECVYVGSYATAASRYARPDTGLLSLEQLTAHAASIAAAVRIPVIADAEAFDGAVPAFQT
jgi:2-methylisocitrate lyase-like PEP mutase family enzyme